MTTVDERLQPELDTKKRRPAKVSPSIIGKIQAMFTVTNVGYCLGVLALILASAVAVLKILAAYGWWTHENHPMDFALTVNALAFGLVGLVLLLIVRIQKPEK